MRLGRSAWVVASMTLLAGGYAAGIATAPAPAEAQGGAVIDLDVYSRLDALEVRVSGLEDEAARPRNLVTAPFRVVDAGGATLASIARGEGGQPELKLGAGIVAGYSQGEPRISISNGARAAGMDLLGGGATLFATPNGDDGFYAGYSTSHGVGARLWSGGAAVAELVAAQGGHAALRLLNGGAVDFSVERGESDRPELKLGDGIILGYAEGEPRMSIFRGDRVAGMHMLDGGATVYASQDGSNGFYAGYNTEHGNSARIFNGGERVADLGAPSGRNAGLRFFTGGNLIAGIGISNAGNGLMVTNQPDGTSAITVGGTGEGHAAVDVHQGGKLAASINTRDLGGSGLVAVYNSGGSGVAYLSEGSGGGIFSATDAAGNEVFGAGFNGSAGVACIRRPNGNQLCLEPTLPLSR